MRVSPVTARWARALFDLASEKGALDQVERDVEFLAAELSVPSVSARLFDARVQAEVKEAWLKLLAKHLHGLTYNFLRLLHDRRRLETLRDLGPAFRALSLERRGMAEGVVEAPRPLDAAELAALNAALSARLGKAVTLETRIVPELLAGVRVFIENKLLDQSAVGRLEGLRARLLAAPLI